jgi:hypothetical protein
MHDDDDGEVVALEKRKRAWDPLQSWSPRQREEGGGENRDNLSAFCFRKAKVATRGGQGRQGEIASRTWIEWQASRSRSRSRQQVSDANRPIKRSKRARCREQDSFHIQTIRSIID